jgi:hypothetical protein
MAISALIKTNLRAATKKILTRLSGRESIADPDHERAGVTFRRGFRWP